MPEGRRQSFRLRYQFDSMDDKRTLRAKVQKARESVVKERQRLGYQIAEHAENAAREAIDLVAQAKRLEAEPDLYRPIWGSYGAAQNLGQHLSALTAQAEVLDDVISLIDQVLERDPT